MTASSSVFLGWRVIVWPLDINSEWHEEYGGLYGVTLPIEYLQTIETQRIDRDEIKKVALLSKIAGNERVSMIDKELLNYWK